MQHYGASSSKKVIFHWFWGHSFGYIRSYQAERYMPLSFKSWYELQPVAAGSCDWGQDVRGTVALRSWYWSEWQEQVFAVKYHAGHQREHPHILDSLTGWSPALLTILSFLQTPVFIHEIVMWLQWGGQQILLLLWGQRREMIVLSSWLVA